MTTVTRRAKDTEQPRGGFINPCSFTKTQLGTDPISAIALDVENIYPSLVGTAVDYMARHLDGATLDEAFEVSIMGACLVDEVSEAMARLKAIKGLDHESLVNACQLVGYDAALRAGPKAYRPVDSILPDKATTANIAIMVNRSLEFFEKYGPVIASGFTFPGGYTDVVTAGDGDFLTADTLWDFKVSVDGPDKNHTLQLLMYYLMGKRSDQSEFRDIVNLGIFNPRLNVVYTLAVSDISQSTIDEVAEKVIGYEVGSGF